MQSIFTIAHLSLYPSIVFDMVFFIAFCLYVWDEVRMGVLISFLNLLSIGIGYVISLILYSFLSHILQIQFSLSPGISDAGAFVGLSFLVSFLIRLTLLYIQRKTREFTLPKAVDITGAFVCGAITFFFLSLVLVTIFLTFPLAEPLRKAVLTSFSGRFLLSNAFIVEHDVKTIFGQAIQDSLHFMTVKPQANESVSLHFSISNPPIDKQAEQEMVLQLNTQRKNNSLPALLVNQALTKASLLHATDMARRSYFSHFTPEGLSPFDRLAKQHITYLYAGENLALAPTVDIAMQGLMRSPGHRANILSDKFGHVGIGVVDLGIYGKIYVQTFSD